MKKERHIRKNGIFFVFEKKGEECFCHLNFSFTYIEAPRRVTTIYLPLKYTRLQKFEIKSRVYSCANKEKILQQHNNYV